MTDSSVLYEERDGIAIIAINRPEKKNTLTESVIQGIADGIDRATRSRDVAAVVLRGVGDRLRRKIDQHGSRKVGIVIITLIIVGFQTEMSNVGLRR